MAKDYVTLRLPRSRLEKVPRETKELARDRTKFLLARLEYAPLTEILADAWLQGVRDAAQATGTIPKEAAQGDDTK